MDKDDQKQAQIQAQLRAQHREMIEQMRKAAHLQLRNSIEHALRSCVSMEGLLSIVNQFVNGAAISDLGIGPKGIAVFVNHSGVPVSLITPLHSFTGFFGSLHMPGGPPLVPPQPATCPPQPATPPVSSDLPPPYSEGEPSPNCHAPQSQQIPIQDGKSPPFPSQQLVQVPTPQGYAPSPQGYSPQGYPALPQSYPLPAQGYPLPQMYPPPQALQASYVYAPTPYQPQLVYPGVTMHIAPQPVYVTQPIFPTLDMRNVCIVYRLGTDSVKSCLPHVQLSMFEMTSEAMEAAPGFRVAQHPHSSHAPIYELFTSSDPDLTVNTFEYQRWYPIKGWSSHLLPTDRDQWSDRTGTLKRPREYYSLPNPQMGPWRWTEDWRVAAVHGDSDGWLYAFDMPSTFGAKTSTSFVRRRLWERSMSKRTS